MGGRGRWPFYAFDFTYKLYHCISCTCSLARKLQAKIILFLDFGKKIIAEISSKHFSILDLNSEESNVFKEIWDIFAKWDQMLDLKNFITFIYPYKSVNDNGDYDLSMKRISIHKENYKTSEITVFITGDRTSYFGNRANYFIERSCEGEKKTDVIQHFFEKSKNRKLS